MARANQDVIAALDIGTTKVVCFIAHVDADGVTHIDGIGHQLSKGARGGVITDVKAAEQSIANAVHAAETMAGYRVEEVIVNLSGGQLLSHNVHVDLPLNGQAVSMRDVRRLVEYGKNQLRSEDAEVIHCLPIGYSIDEARGVSDPCGMYGSVLGADLHMITMPPTALKNLSHCIGRAHLNIQEFMVSSYASGLACLAEDERELGVTLLDIGGGVSSLSVFVDGKPVYTDVIPIGGGHVTNDIARGLSTGIAEAERIKALYGSVYASHADEHEMIEVPRLYPDEDEAGEATMIPRSMLSGIIRPRMEELFEMVRGRLEESGFERLAGRRMVLTGGGSQLLGITDLASRVMNKQVRLGKPRNVDGLAVSVSGAGFSTCIGMVDYRARAILRQRRLAAEQVSTMRNPVHKMVEWLRDRFEVQ